MRQKNSGCPLCSTAFVIACVALSSWAGGVTANDAREVTAELRRRLSGLFPLQEKIR